MSLVGRIDRRQLLVAVVVLGVVFPFAAYAVPALVGADESYVVLTGSMRPAIAPGDVVFVSATPASAIAVGDVITFDRGADVPTTHRVIEVVEENGAVLFRTQGDANEDPDAGIVTAASVVGVVTLTIPFLGTAITAIDSQYGFVALVVLPFALLVLDVAYGAIRARRATPDADTGSAESVDATVAGTGAGAVDRRLPAVYDPVEAAAAYYEAAAMLGRDRPAADEGSALTGRDMTASIGVAALLVAYAGWNAYWQLTTLDAPRPETMSVLSGAFVGLAFLVYVRYTGSAAETSGSAREDPTAAATAPDRTRARATPASVPAAEFAPQTAAATVARDEEVQYAD